MKKILKHQKALVYKDCFTFSTISSNTKYTKKVLEMITEEQYNKAKQDLQKISKLYGNLRVALLSVKQQESDEILKNIHIISDYFTQKRFKNKEKTKQK